MEADALAALDRDAPPWLRALSWDRGPKRGSHATPHAFVCSDGRTYWLKRNAQHGLIAELVAGRLGAEVGAAPMAVPVEVTSQALGLSGEGGHLLGLAVGMADEPAMDNFQDITERAPDGNLEAARLDAASVARVIAFQTWIGAEDTQILVDLRSGKLLSVDHGALQAIGTPGSAPSIVIASGIPADIGREARFMRPIVERIEQVSDETILRAVAGPPTEQAWEAGADRRLVIAESLALRRDALRQVLGHWIQ